MIFDNFVSVFMGETHKTDPHHYVFIKSPEISYKVDEKQKLLHNHRIFIKPKRIKTFP